MVKALSDAAGVNCCCAPGVPLVCHGFDFECSTLLTMSATGVTALNADQSCSYMFSMSICLELTAAQNPTWLATCGVPVPGGLNCILKGSWSLSVTNGPCSSSGGALCSGQICVPPCNGAADIANIKCNAGPEETWIALFGMIFPIGISLGYSQPLSVGCPGGGPWTFLGGTFGNLGQITSGGTFTVA